MIFKACPAPCPSPLGEKGKGPDEGLSRRGNGRDYRFCVGSAPARFSASSEAAQLT